MKHFIKTQPAYAAAFGAWAVLFLLVIARIFQVLQW